MNTELIDLLNQSNYIFYFLVVDNFLDISLFPKLKNFHLIYAYKSPIFSEYEKNKTPYFCLEEKGIKLSEKNTGKLLSHPKVIEYIKFTSSKLKLTSAIIPFKPSAKIDFLCQKNHWINISNPGAINRFLEDKIKFPLICKKYNLPFIPSVVDVLTETNFQKYQKQFKQNKLVIQTHFGWAGKSTFQAHNWNEIEKQITLGTTVKFSPFLDGYSLLNNCCLTKFGLIQSPPALQYTGVHPFTDNPFTTVGRQWPSLAPKIIQNQIKNISEKFSQILTEIGYKGFFGLDFFVDKKQVYLLECNPRLTASFAFYTEMEFKNNITPLFLFHLADFLKLDYQIDLKKEQQRFNQTELIGSEITLKNKQNNTIKKYNHFSVFSKSLNPIIIDPQIIKLTTDKSA